MIFAAIPDSQIRLVPTSLASESAWRRDSLSIERLAAPSHPSIQAVAMSGTDQEIDQRHEDSWPGDVH
jgi:hypothetical protein